MTLLASNFPHSLLPLAVGGGGVLPYKRLMGMYCWMGSHFHYWFDYNGVSIFNRVTTIMVSKSTYQNVGTVGEKLSVLHSISHKHISRK